MTADHTSTANMNQHEMINSEWTNINQGMTALNYDPSKENMDDEDIYGAMDLVQMNSELPEEPPTYL